MTELFRLSIDAISPIPEKPFLNEVGDLENFVIKNPSLLGEGTSIAARQISAGAAGRLDILAVSQTPGGGQVAVVELKNGVADVHVLLQALRYADWAVANPDSLKLLLSKGQLDTNEIELRPRIVVVAPLIQEELVELSQWVGSFEFDFVEIKRFQDADESFVVVTHKTPSTKPPPPVAEREEWNWEAYAARHGWKEPRIELGQRLLDRLRLKVDSKGWPLVCQFRKWHIAFQLSATKNVIGLSNKSAKEWWMWCRLPRSPQELGLPPIPYPSKWESGWKGFSAVFTDWEADMDCLDPYFEAAYKWAIGEIS